MRKLSLGVRTLAAVTLCAGFAAGAQAQTVQVALGDVLSLESLAFAIALERAKDKGFDYKLTSFSKEDLAIQAVVSGQAQIGGATPFSVMQKSRAPIRGVFQMTRLVFFPVTDKAAYPDWKSLNGQPFTFHARGSGTEAIGNILAKRNGIEFGQRNYVPGSENRVVAMLNGQIKATIVDLANKNLLMQRGGDRFHALPGHDSPATDEMLFVRQDWAEKNAATLDMVVEEFYRLWTQMAKDPSIIDEERKKRGLLKDLPAEVTNNTTAFYTQGVKEGVYSKSGGDEASARADFEFYVEAGQLTGPAASLKVEDFWNFAPLAKAKAKVGS
ncbi:MAG: ABC transporter substrate-binding protein [Thalassobaculales bacterium]